MDECIFCSIVGKTVPATVVFENDEVVAFEDTNPRSPVHLLVIPKAHVGSVDQAGSERTEQLGQALLAATAVGKQETDGNFSLSINAGNLVDVDHFHIHVRGNRKGGDDT